MQPLPLSPRCFSIHDGFEGHQNWALNLSGCLLPATRHAQEGATSSSLYSHVPLL